MRPNIVFITAHDLGRHLGIYGQATVQSPNLDALATNGILFTNSFCTAPQCSPSRASLHTGRHAHSNGMFGLAHVPNAWRMYQHVKHLAHYLRENGYLTALVGLQHLTDDPAELGFDILPDLPAIGDARTSLPPTPPADEIAAQVEGFLDTVPDSPFYLEVGFFEVHRPFDFGGSKPDDELGAKVPDYLPDSESSRQEVAALQGMIRQLDAAIGRIITSLEAHALLDNTWLVFTTDHGVAMPRAKCTLYDAGLETALIMHYPAAGLVGGKQIGEMLSHVDMVPTILDMLDIPLPAQLQGHSYHPLLMRESFQPNLAVYAEKTFHTRYEPMRSIRTQNHKLIVNLTAGDAFDVPGDIRMGEIYPQIVQKKSRQKRPPFELYDLNTDPLEKINLWGQAEYAQTGDDLRMDLLNWMLETEDPILRGPIPSPFYLQTINVLNKKAR